jgi:Concanavalin A-like lectin/glucanases superfamily
VGTSLYNRVGKTFPYAISVPTKQLTAVANTKMLCMQNASYKDNSSLAAPMGVFGAAGCAILPWNPLSVTKPYSPSTLGSNIYFSSGYLDVTIPPTTMSGDFTVEFWHRNYTNNGRWIDTSATQDGFSIWTNGTGYIFFYINGTQIISATPTYFYTGCWNHIAVTRSGSTITMWLNGVSVATATSSAAVNLGTSFRIGKSGGPSSLYAGGFLSNLRLVNGTAVYTGYFTPPTTPVTAIANTLILFNADKGGIYDYSMCSFVLNYYNAKVSTAQSISGGSSMYFDGNSWIQCLSGPLNDFQAGDFTVECWIYPVSLGTAQAIINRGTEASLNGASFKLYLDTDGTIFSSISINGATSIGGNTSNKVNLNQWNHIALSCSSNVYRTFINGVQGLSFSGVYSLYYISSHYIWLGSNGTSPKQYYTGYIDEVRITKGIGRYTTNFAPNTFANITG